MVLEGLGGKGNVVSLDNCITRLRLEIKDYTLVDEKRIKSAGVAGVMRPQDICTGSSRNQGTVCSG
ncbi:MAG: PTS transporter subunit EIIB [Enterocloster clostridioformis]